MMLRRQNTSFELTLSIFAVVVLMLGVTIWLLIPEVKNYLQLQEEVHATVQKSDRLQMEYDRLYEEKEMMEAEEAALSDRFENRVDAAQLHQWIRTVWTDATVKASSEEGAFGRLLRRRWRVEGGLYASGRCERRRTATASKIAGLA
ncbi:MAG: hypothetical protein P8Y51_04620 [Campylobacterales bacterium]